jgi:hypothetical protein
MARIFNLRGDPLDGHLTHKTGNNRAATTEVIDLRPDAARKRLRECSTQSEACEAIREIASNLLGCEEMALFHLQPRNTRLSLIWCFGVAPAACHFPALFKDAALPRVMAGEHYIQNDTHHGAAAHRAPVSALLPIKFNGGIAGALALLRLLPQKPMFDPLDQQVFDVLSSEAGKPLFGGTARRHNDRERKR